MTLHALLTCPSASRRRLTPWVVTGAILFALPSFALQPLDDFLKSAKKNNFTRQDADANARAQNAQWLATLGRALPQLQLRGTYTRNQYESIFSEPPNNTPEIFIPYQQWDGYAIINVPLVDLASFARIAAASQTADAAGAQSRAVDLAVEAQVAQTYYQLVADRALVDASQRAVEVAQTSLKLTASRVELGTASKLDLDRAKGDVERQVQQVAESELQLVLATRALESLTRLTPEVTANQYPEDDLQEPAPLDSLVPKDLNSLPSVENAHQTARAQHTAAVGSVLAVAPAVGASASEHWTNAPGFVISNHYWTALLTATWTFDLTTVGNMGVQSALSDSAQARYRQASLNAADDIHRTWSAVRANIARSRSARVQRQVSDEAASLAQDRYRVGSATQLDLLQAQRDAFSATATSIQADADLANARAALKLTLGQDLLP